MWLVSLFVWLWLFVNDHKFLAVLRLAVSDNVEEVEASARQALPLG